LRTFEVITALLLLVSMLRWIMPSRPRWMEFLPSLALVAAVLQLFIEGYRWQMLPLYVIGLALFLFSVRPLLKPAGKNAGTRLRIVGLLAGLALFVAAIALPILLPIPRLPALSGPYQVGTFSMMLTDTSRKEIYSGNPSDPRRIMVQVWYPAEPAPGSKTAPWMDRADIVGPAIATYLDLPAFFLDHLIYVRTGAFLDAPISHVQPTYPVLLFSHGWNGFRAQNTYQAINLASNGYVVVAIDHTYGAVVTAFPDGQLAYNNPHALPEGNLPDSEYIPIANKLVNQWAGDLGFVLDTLTSMNASDSTHGLTGSLDLERVGVFGHSTGGGATVEFCGRDPRCKAGLGLDAYLRPVSETILETGLRQPFLFMFSQSWPSEKNWTLFNEMNSNSDNAVVVTILGTGHYDFSDLPILSPIAPQMGLKGPLASERVVKIMVNYPLAFFNQVFYGKSTTLLDGPSADYPEVVFP
jgi:pimeloyl-ACP methyl ester carboxylesterase